MNKTKRNILIILIVLLLLSSIVIFLNFQKETVEFGDFSIEVPLGTSFGKVRENDTMIKEMYRCYGEDLTITSFNKTYVEDTYNQNTGEKIDFTKSLIENLTGSNNSETKDISSNLTQITHKSSINGHEDTDVACIYHDDGHLIIIEGGDEDFITEIAESIQIL
ncbi:hypothetical protein [Methanobrevibacter sp.]